MTDQVDNTQNPLIPPPKKDELSQADPNQFKQVMKELTTDTEQKGKWKPQKEDQFDDENINTTDDTDDVTTPYVSGDTDIGETTQAGSSAASSQVSGASQVGLPDNGEEDGIITPQRNSRSPRGPASRTRGTSWSCPDLFDAVRENGRRRPRQERDPGGRSAFRIARRKNGKTAGGCR